MLKTKPLASLALQFPFKFSPKYYPAVMILLLGDGLRMRKCSCILILIALFSAGCSSANNAQDRRYVFRDPSNKNNQIITSKLHSDTRNVQQKPPLDESWLLSAIQDFAGTVQNDPYSLTTKKYVRLTTTAPAKPFSQLPLRELPLKVKYNTFSPTAEQFSEFKLRQIARLTTPKSSEVSVTTTKKRKLSTRPTPTPTTATTTTEDPAYDEYESAGSTEEHDSPNGSGETVEPKNPFDFKVNKDTYPAAKEHQASTVTSTTPKFTSTTLRLTSTTKRFLGYNLKTRYTEDLSSDLTPEDLSDEQLSIASSKVLNKGATTTTRNYKLPRVSSTTTKPTTTTTRHLIVRYKHGYHDTTSKPYKRSKTTLAASKSTATTTTQPPSYIQEMQGSDGYESDNSAEDVNNQQLMDAALFTKGSGKVDVTTKHYKRTKATPPTPKPAATSTNRPMDDSHEIRDTEDYSGESNSEDFHDASVKDTAFSDTEQTSKEISEHPNNPNLVTSRKVPATAEASDELGEYDYEEDDAVEYSSETDIEDNDRESSTTKVKEEVNTIPELPATTSLTSAAPASTATSTAAGNEYTGITREAVLNIWNFFNGRLVHAGKHKIPVGTRDTDEEPGLLSGSTSLILQLLANNIAVDQHGNYHVVDSVTTPSSGTQLNYNSSDLPNASTVTTTVSSTTPTTTTTTTSPSTSVSTAAASTTTTTVTTPMTTATKAITATTTTRATVIPSTTVVHKSFKPQEPKIAPLPLHKTESTTQITKWPYPGSSTTLGSPIGEYKAPPVEAFLPDFLLEQGKQPIHQRNTLGISSGNTTWVSLPALNSKLVVPVPVTTQQAITQSQQFSSSTVQSWTTAVSSTTHPESRPPATFPPPLRVNPLQVRVQQVRPAAPLAAPTPWNTIMTLGISMLPSMALALPLVVPFVGRKKRQVDLPPPNEVFYHVSFKAH